jgi:hypothetical protein
MHFRPLSLSIALLALLALLPGSAPAGQTERVVLVIIDGLRYSEGLGDPARTHVPEMSALAAQGALVEPFLNDGYTYTSRAIPAIWCGAWTGVSSFSDPDCGGTSNSYAELPTVFEYFRKGLSRPAEDCIYILKNLCSWKASFDLSYGPAYWPLYHEEGVLDTDVWQEAQTVLATQSPSFLLLYLAGVDYAGHHLSWNEYLAAIETADGIVGDLWQALQADPDYAGKTTMLVTNDHGRHTTDFTGHGDGCAGCRTIQLLAIGPDIQPGLVSTVPRSIPDVTPTIGALLGFPTPLATGSAMEELFRDPTGVGDDPVPGTEGLWLKLAPNPTRRGTEARFFLPRAARVSAFVHDLAGRRVAGLLDREMEAGEHAFNWSGRDAGGGSLAAGVYFLSVTTAEMNVTRKIVLLP